MKTHQMITTTFFTAKRQNFQGHSYYNLFLVLDGYVNIAYEQSVFTLNEKDILLTVPADTINIHPGKALDMICLSIEPSFIYDYIDVGNGYFVCNSTTDHYRDYSGLRNIIIQFASTQMNNMHSNILKKTNLTYTLLNHLATYHFEPNYVLPNDIDDINIRRAGKIMDFIKNNYTEFISLKQAAELLHMSESHFSKVFKQTFKQSFFRYLNNYRIDQSLKDLLYTKKSINNISLDYGFPNTNAYIKVFKEKYGSTPNNYRNNYLHNIPKPLETHNITNTEAELDRIKDLISVYSHAEADHIHPSHIENKIFVSVNSPTPLHPIWKTGINISHPFYMDRKHILDDLEYIQNGCQFQYGRIPFIITHDFLSSTTPANASLLSFTHVINRLYSMRMKPILDLSITDEKMNTANLDVLLRAIENLIVYSINTFGLSSVEQWIFDIGLEDNFITGEIEYIETYIRRFLATYTTIKNYLPNARVGGFYFMPALSMDYFDAAYSLLLNKGVIPDFVSLALFPYAYVRQDRETMLTMTSDRCCSVKFIKTVRDHMTVLHKDKRYIPPIYVTGFGPTIAHRSYINDTCYQSSYLIKNMIDLIGETDLVCPFQLSDSSFSFDENQLLLDGRNGLMAQFGIPKPGALALILMSRIKGGLLAKGDGYLITQENENKYYILLCNHVELKQDYCLTPQKVISATEAYLVYSSSEDQNIAITLDHIKNGTYQIISHHITRDHGSIFDEWAKRNYSSYIGNDELNYYKQSIHPHRNYTQREIDNYQLNFHIRLHTFEVALIEITAITKSFREQ